MLLFSNARNYGYKKLSDLVRATDMFEVRETPHSKSAAVKDFHIRLKS
ncbi:OST-HTH/LOTUS domain-containing protein [Leptolyngbyaceae cyanobacterium UHCC 1019]